MPALVIHLTVPDTDADRVIDGIALAKNYEGIKLEGETKREFIDRQLLEFLFDGVASAEGETAASAAGNTARASARAIDITAT